MKPEQDQFDRLARAVLDDYLEQFPQEAVGAGKHKYDGRITELDPGALSDWVSRLHRQSRALAEVDPSDLDADGQLDLEVLKGVVAYEAFRAEDRRLFRRSPMDVVALLDPTPYVKRDYAPLEDRAAALARHLGQVPRVLAEARVLLEVPLPAPDTTTAAGLLDGLSELVATGLDDALAGLPELSQGLADEVMQARTAAADAISGFAHWLRSLEESGGVTTEFAMGEAAMAKMLLTAEAVQVPLDRLQTLGSDDLARNQRALAVVTQALDPDQAPADVLRELDQETPDPDDLIPATESVVEELVAWMDSQAVVSLPGESELRIEQSPPHLRWAFAWMSAPGAFEETELSYFYVTEADRRWDAGRQKEWMSKFSSGRLCVVAMHETYPGHFVHHLHVRRIKSDTRRFFGAYSAWEAWAHYSEQMATEAGFRPDDLRVRAAQLAEAILRDVRLLVALGLHAGGMSLEEAQALFEQQAYLPPAAAEAEAVRGTFDPGYLNYTLGKLMLLKLRDDARARAKQSGEGFHLREFHDRYLAYGPAPLPLVRRAMLGADSGEPL